MVQINANLEYNQTVKRGDIVAVSRDDEREIEYVLVTDEGFIARLSDGIVIHYDLEVNEQDWKIIKIFNTVRLE